MNSTNHILLVEDSETQALRLQLLFVAQGWPTERASTGEEAIAKLSEIVPDLIILDHYLPGLRGVELCNLLRLKTHGWNPPILMLTADYASKIQRESVESGADAYLSKSVEDSVLLRRVGALLGQSEMNRRAAGKGATASRQARLLAVDDSPTDREYLTHELSSDGHAAETAAVVWKRSKKSGLTATIACWWIWSCRTWMESKCAPRSRRWQAICSASRSS